MSVQGVVLNLPLYLSLIQALNFQGTSLSLLLGSSQYNSWLGK